MKLGIKQWVFEVVLGVFVTRRTPPASPPDARIERELRRVMAMTPDEVRKSLVARGFDLDQLDARMREMMRPLFPERFPLH
jgi:hypothetical protein